MLFNSYFLCLAFSEGGPKLSDELDCDLCASWPGCYIPIFPTVSNIIAGLIIRSTALSLWRSCGIVLIPWFPYESSSKVFGGTALQLRSDAPGSILPTLCYRRPLTKNVSRGSLTLSQNGFIFAIFSI